MRPRVRGLARLGGFRVEARVLPLLPSNVLVAMLSICLWWRVKIKYCMHELVRIPLMALAGVASA